MQEQEKQGPRASAQNKVSGRQVYCYAHLLVEIAGLSWPSNAAEASQLISTLQEQRDALKAQTTDVPF